MIKRFLSLILVIASIFTLFACEKEKNREYERDVVLSEAKKLIRESESLNFIYYGEGIKYSEKEEDAKGAYYKADFNHLTELGFKTIDELKEKTYKTYTKAYSEIIISTKLSSVIDSDGIQGYARYYQSYSDKEKKNPDHIMVYSKAVILLNDEVEYLYDTLEVAGVKGEVITVTLNVNVKRGDKTQNRVMKVNLIEEESGFRLDSPTYIVFDEELS